MDEALVKILAELPLTFVLLYLIVKQQAQIEKLQSHILEMNQQHSRDLLQIVMNQTKPTDILSRERLEKTNLS